MKKKNFNRENKQEVIDIQRMTSLEIALVTGKQHKDVMRAVRNMEPAWERVNGRKFALVEYKDAKGERRPCYELTKTECLYIATKFNDEARARLVLRWQDLELAERERQAARAQVAPFIDLSGSKGSQANIVLIVRADGNSFVLSQELLARLAEDGRLLPALPEYHP